MRRRLPGTFVALATLLPVLALTPGSSGTPARPGALVPAPAVSPATPLPGERFTVRGGLGVTGKRAVQLQRRAPSGGWAVVGRARTTSTGRYSFVTRTAVPVIRVRVVAPRTTRAKARVSAVRTILTRDETSGLSLAGDRETVTAKATLSPARPGRLVQLQVNEHGWRTIATSRQGTAATLTWKVHDRPGLPQDYRLSALTWKGADAHVGAPVTFAAQPVDAGVPRLHLSTTGAVPVDNREDYRAGTLRVGTGPALAMEIKGRGNTTWAFPKKPYRIKLGTKSALLGLPSEKDWVLLANYADLSLLRTWSAFKVAQETSLAWTPGVRFVDVSLNGVDLGSYLLTEQVEEEAAKVALAPGGLLLEIDQRFEANGDPGFRTAIGTGIGFKDPDTPSDAQKADAATFLDTFESVLYGTGYADPGTGYRAYVDLDSFADWYLVNEFMKNLDADFLSSVFFAWDPAGKLTMGPVWDFDYSAGFGLADPCCADPTGWWLRGGQPGVRTPIHQNHWLARMLTDPYFDAAVADRWTGSVRDAIDAMIAALPAEQTAVAESARLDWRTWHAGAPAGSGVNHGPDQASETAYLRDWLTQRRNWMDSQLS